MALSGPLSILLVMTFAFLAARTDQSVRAGVITGLAVAFADSTFGWAISWLVGPGALVDPSPSWIVWTVIAVTGAGALEGAAAGWLAMWSLRRARAKELHPLKRDM